MKEERKLIILYREFQQRCSAFQKKLSETNLDLEVLKYFVDCVSKGAGQNVMHCVKAAESLTGRCATVVVTYLSYRTRVHPAAA